MKNFKIENYQVSFQKTVLSKYNTRRVLTMRHKNGTTYEGETLSEVLEMLDNTFYHPRTISTDEYKKVLAAAADFFLPN